MSRPTCHNGSIFFIWNSWYHTFMGRDVNDFLCCSIIRLKVMSVKNEKKKKKSSSPDNHFRINVTFLRPHSLGMLSLFTIKAKKLFWYFMTSAKFFPLQA